MENKLEYTPDMPKTKKKPQKLKQSVHKPVTPIGKMLTKIREDRDHSQVSFAKELGISRSYISTVELSQVDEPLDYIKRLWFLMTSEEKNEIERLLIEQLKAELRGGS